MQFNFRLALAGALACALFSAPLARADTLVTPSTEYLKRIKTGETIEPFDDTPFGESISLFTGAISFRQTDISYPGIGPTITLARTYEASGSPTSYMNDRPMGDWDLSIPRIETLIPGRAMGLGGSWDVDGNVPTARCSQIGPVANPFAYGQPWWHGYQLVTPDGASQPLLLRGTLNTLAPGNDTARYPIVTPAHWMISCLPATSNGMPGESFLATAPDGSKYTFDHLNYGAAAETLLEHLRDQGPPGGPLFAPRGHGGPNKTPIQTVYNGVDVLIMARQQAQMKLTRLEDRFGNFLTYSYNLAGQLLEINASDGRRVSITWRTDAALVDRITLQPGSAQARVWQYLYSGGVLVKVIQPDASSWAFAMGSTSAAHVDSSFAAGVCGIRSADQMSGGGVFMTLVHPSGLTGQFELGVRHQGRSQVPTTCLAAGYEPASEATPPIYNSLSLVARTFSGPGVSSGTWRYVYSPVFASTAAECAAGAQCKDTKWVEITDPQLRTTHHTFSTRWGYMEGKLLGSIGGITVSGLEAPVGLQIDKLTYALPTAGPYPKSLGVLFADPAAGSNAAPTESISPENLHQTIRQGVTFSRQNLSFDRFGQPLKVKRWSTLGTKTDTTTYWPVTNLWVLGQVNTVVDLASGKVVTRIDYDAAMLPIRTYGFGILRQTLAYNANGTLAYATDGRGFSTGLGDWYRGVPRLINFPDGTSIGASVDDVGNVRSVTNELGSATGYSYDSMGRISGVTYPAGDSTAWNGSTQSFAQVGAAEYGIAAGHWKQVKQTGNGRVSTFYDGSWRPLLTLTEDLGNPASKSFLVSRYDNAGQQTFSGYPVSSLTGVSDSLDGTSSVYDALGRPIQARQSSELGDLLSTTDYLAGFQVRTTNPRGYATTAAFQAFDSPSTDAPLKITLPEGVTTVIARDIFGKPNSITRSGLYLGVNSSAVRRYIYDGNDRLCKTINPESGASLVDYDAAGNIAWSVDGSVLTTLTCNRISVLDAAKTYRQYDSRSRVTLVSSPGGSADVTTSYFADGAIKSLVAANPGGYSVGTAYSYNKRRLLTGESSSNGSTLFGLGYAYNTNGHLAAATYPDGQTVAIQTDALGRTTSMASADAAGPIYANNVRYYPNGAISGFSFGNAAIHSMSQNRRRLPARTRDVSGSAVVMDDSYSFDPSGNVTDITDQAQAGLTTRGMGYDGLDRLTVAVSPGQWGSASFGYDVLDNLRSADQGSSRYRYNYSAAANRLTSVSSPEGVLQFDFGYDAGGNVVRKGSQAFQFDSSNRLNQVTGKETYRYDGMGRRVQTTDADGKTTFWMYSRSGQVLYTSEARRSRNISYIYLGNSLVATRTNAWGTGLLTMRWQHTDALGSAVATTIADGSIPRRVSFMPYGASYGATTIDGVGYTGHVMDAGTGLTYMQQRYYDPAVGRFLSTDPASSDFNAYNYANNNPYKFTDPDGRQTVPLEVKKVVDLAANVVNGIRADVVALANAAQNDQPMPLGPLLRIATLPLVGELGAVGRGAAGVEAASAEVASVADVAKVGNKLPKPPTGPGRVPKAERDPKRFFSPSAREAKRADQGHQCGNGCEKAIDGSNSAGHHIERHADGGQTVSENHAEVCIPCHKELHSAGDP